MLILGALLIAGAVVAQVVAERNGEAGPPLSSRSSSAGGALALARWLERIGYTVERLEGTSSADLADGAMLFVLEPIRGFDHGEAEAILSWVRRGGSLVYVPGEFSVLSQAFPTLAADALSAELGVAQRLVTLTDDASPALPFFTAPPASRFRVHTRDALDLRDESWVPLIAQEERVIAATRQIGSGRVYAAASDALFANSDLGKQANAAFVLNILARHPETQSVVFEEVHHAAEAAFPGLMGEMRASPWGWAVIYASMLTMFFLFWAGRRFGPAVVPVREPARSSGEYITAFAGLLQRTRATDWMQRQLAQVLRRRLARLLGVRADLPADEAARLFADRHGGQPEQLAASLVAIDGAPIGEQQLLTQVRALEEMLWRARTSAR